MKKFTPVQKLLMFIYAVAILLFCHHFIIRPWLLDWGSTEMLEKITLSGDHFSEGESHTRSILVHARPEKVWPWITQLGQDRGGFYSYQWLENLFRADMHNVYQLKPEFQSPRVAGDTIRLASKESYDGLGYQVLAEVTPMRSFVMVGGEDYARLLRGEKAIGSWAIYLYPEKENTWLIARSTGGETTLLNKVLRYSFFEVPHFIMERKMLKTIRNLVEEHK